MAFPPIDPVSDSRIQHKTAVLNGHTYHYLHGMPATGEVKATIFLVHGWPDLSLGWRYQIPFLQSMGCQVVAMDMMGYGGTDAPTVPPNNINLYGYKRASDDIAELAKQLGAPQIVLGGHDWGGMVVWRCAQWHPELISHVFSVCTPYTPVSEKYFSTEDLANGPLPQFGYQLHLASGEVEKVVNSEATIRQFLKGIFGAKTPEKGELLHPVKGIIVENLPKVGESRLLNGKVQDYYVKEYSRHGIYGPLNWYRARKANWEEEKAILDKNTISIPTLFIQATDDAVLTPEMSKGMERFLPNLTRAEVKANHWAMLQKPQEVNSILKKWLEKHVLGTVTRSSL